MSNLLIHEEPLLVLPGLASRIGLNEAIFLQQIHYWLNRSKHFYDERNWVYNSVAEWVKQFPFWSENTIRRIVKNLEDEQLLVIGNYNRAKFDKTKWYSINYEKLRLLESTNDVPNLGRRSTQNGQMDVPNLGKPIPETNTETTSEIKEYIVEIVNYLNDVCGSSYRLTSKKTQTLIKTRLVEGFTVDDFKTVIDTKAREWLRAEQAKYLRPETLFGTKFESYLQQGKVEGKHGSNKGNRYSKDPFEEDDLPF
ncbi:MULTISPECIES: conserved phage C-terminal domain-containing protein [Bacillus]|uniref:conserved phage C-terminal domain-containing protein n=1 Tax=Bacillus TaxID=1386 RepID=UPI000BF0A8CF|nr:MULTISPECIES: conserved phage C-terminal domain-containing protein [Bacillus]MBY7100539.1 phage protein [Bacillus sp. 6YEL31]PEK36127.1 replication protein [Bacillus toyonensis]PEL70709.1 replication protein [Bacillus toyonensis]PFY22699.1 replication protein [Bacillus toyonensis]PGE43141.1 replication protein [Bacillus toyonensis]